MSTITTVESIAELTAILAPVDGQTVYVKSYHAGLGKGGGMFIYNTAQAALIDDVTIFNGWNRENQSEYSIYDSGIYDFNLDNTEAFQKLVEITSKKGKTLDLNHKTFKITTLDLFDNTCLKNGCLDFMTSIAHQQYGRSPIMLKITNRNTSIDYEEASTYKILPVTKNIVFENILFKGKKRLILLFKVNGLTFRQCKFYWENAYAIKVVGGWHTTPLVNDTPISYNLINPINGWSENIDVINCEFKAQYNKTDIEFEIPHPTHFVACKNVTVSGGYVDTVSGHRVDIYNRDIVYTNVTYNNTNFKAIEDTVNGTALPDLLGMYIGQNTYNVRVSGCSFTNFPNKGIYIEAASYVDINNNLFNVTAINKATCIDVQPNYRDAQNTKWGNVSNINISNNDIKNVNYGIITSPYQNKESIKKLVIKGNFIEINSTLPAISVSGVNDYWIENNSCTSSLALNENIKTGNISNNSFINTQNYSLYISDLKDGYFPTIINNHFHVHNGSTIYNNGGLEKNGLIINGIITSETSSPLMELGENPSNLICELFNYGAENQFIIEKKLTLLKDEKIFFYINNSKFKSGWSCSVNLMDIDIDFPNVDLLIKSSVLNNSVCVIVENKGKSDLTNKILKFVVKLNTYLDNQHLN